MTGLLKKPEEIIESRLEGLKQAFLIQEADTELSTKQNSKLRELVMLGFKSEDIVYISKKSNLEAYWNVIDSLTTTNSIEALQKLTKPIEEEGFGFVAKDISKILSGLGQTLEDAIQCLKLFVINFYHGHEEIRLSKSKEVISRIVNKFSPPSSRGLLLKTDTYRSDSSIIKQIRGELGANFPQPAIVLPLEVPLTSSSSQDTNVEAQSLFQPINLLPSGSNITNQERDAASALLSLSSKDQNPSTRPKRPLENVAVEFDERAHKIANSKGRVN